MITKTVDQLEDKELEVFNYFNNLIFKDSPKDIRFWVAGGACRKAFADEHHLYSDIDVYFPSPKEFEILKQYLLNNGGKVEWESPNQLTIEKGEESFGLIKQWQLSPVDTIGRFDFTVCCCAIERSGMSYHPKFKEHLDQKLLYYHAPRIGDYLSRLQKYTLKGYMAPVATLQALRSYLLSYGYDNRTIPGMSRESNPVIAANNPF